jgi:hypothetical protein
VSASRLLLCMCVHCELVHVVNLMLCFVRDSFAHVIVCVIVIVIVVVIVIVIVIACVCAYVRVHRIMWLLRHAVVVESRELHDFEAACVGTRHHCSHTHTRSHTHLGEGRRRHGDHPNILGLEREWLGLVLVRSPHG